TSDWPNTIKVDSNHAETSFKFLIELISEIRSIRSELRVPPSNKIKLFINGDKGDLLNTLNKNIKELERMARLSSIEIIDILSDNLIQFSISGISFGLDLNGVIDVQQELDRLDKELKKINIDLSAVDKKLSNEQFLNNAPKEIIEKQESIRKELNSNKDEIISSIEKISKIS
ncbi:MAG: hypothetical protein VW974_05930, partial [Hyphomicrobiales bacterium]